MQNSEHMVLYLSSRSSVVQTEGLDVVINVYQRQINVYQRQKAFIKVWNTGLEGVDQVSKGVHQGSLLRV